MATNSAAHLFRKSLADQILSQRLQNQWPRGFKLMNLIRVLTLMKPRLKITCQEIRFIQHHTISYNGLTSPFGTSRLPGATVTEDDRSTVRYTDLCAVGTGTKCSGLWNIWHIWHIWHQDLGTESNLCRLWVEFHRDHPWPWTWLPFHALHVVSILPHHFRCSKVDFGLWTAGTATIAWLHFNCQNGFATAAQCSQQDIVAK